MNTNRLLVFTRNGTGWRGLARIAAELFLSPPTVEIHCSNLLKKPDMKNTAELMRYALENKLEAGFSVPAVLWDPAYYVFHVGHYLFSPIDGKSNRPYTILCKWGNSRL